jgi:hypothetical protein
MVRCQSGSGFFNYCVRQVERKGGMSDVGVSPLVQAPALIQDMGTVHEWFQSVAFGGPAIDALNMPS